MRCMGMTEGIKVCLTLLGFVIATCAKPRCDVCHVHNFCFHRNAQRGELFVLVVHPFLTF